ncbi:NUDIX hydrolase [Primorskyibacter aestuariivivens]|nr:NUDIX hydrolase [Primorskyibacter aestuariivivens]MDA7427414.1 NUDIX hydrolase [Primorskyibacter aestuariivivens]
MAVLTDGDRVLLARRENRPDAGLWGFPGGKVELGETLFDAAIRELEEETTLRARAVHVIDNLDVIRRNADGQLQMHFHLVAVLCADAVGKVKASDDVSEADWHKVSAVLGGHLALSKDVDRVLRRALEFQAAFQAVAGS